MKYRSLYIDTEQNGEHWNYKILPSGGGEAFKCSWPLLTEVEAEVHAQLTIDWAMLHWCPGKHFAIVSEVIDNVFHDPVPAAGSNSLEQHEVATKLFMLWKTVDLLKIEHGPNFQGVNFKVYHSSNSGPYGTPICAVRFTRNSVIYEKTKAFNEMRPINALEPDKFADEEKPEEKPPPWFPK